MKVLSTVLMSFAIGLTTVASMWEDGGKSGQAAGNLEQQFTRWQCGPTTAAAAGQQRPSAGAEAPDPSYVACPPSYLPMLQSVSAGSVFRALGR